MSKAFYRRIATVLLLPVAAIGVGVSFQACTTGGGKARTQPPSTAPDTRYEMEEAKPPEAPAPAAASSCPQVPNLSAAQLALVMAFAANTSGGLNGQDTAKLQTVTKARVQCLLDAAQPGWTVVWGPVVVVRQNPVNPPAGSCQATAVPPEQRGKYIPANTMFVAQKGSSEYFVGIAGTNQKSAFAWCDEDFTVTLTAWPFGSPPSGAQIVQGTLDGLNILIAMKDLTQPASQQQTLSGFFQKAASSSTIQISVAGHSLGGALAPVAAAWLNETRSTWDSTGVSSIATYAFAGATPGNASFATYLNGQFSGNNLVVINNTLDVVPHAWNSTTMNQIDGLYLPQIQPTGSIATLIAKLVSQAGPEYTRLGTAAQQQCITGALLPPDQLNAQGPCLLFEVMTAAQIQALQPFGMEAVDQHVCAYPTQLQLPNLLSQEGYCNIVNPGT